MTLESTPTPDGIDYLFPARVVNIVDGDTFDAIIDLGFGIRRRVRVRTRDIDTREISFVETGSEEYQRGMAHLDQFGSWVQDSRDKSDVSWPFYLYSYNYKTGSYGRIIGDLWSRSRNEWISRHLYNTFEDVSLYE